MLEFAQLPRPWPLGDEAAQQKLLRKLKPQHWFPHEDDDERSDDDNSSGETRPRPPDLMELEDPQYFTTDTHCNAWHCRETCDASCEEMAAYDEDSVETAFGLNRIFSVRDREFCGGCPNIEQAPCDCNRDASCGVSQLQWYSQPNWNTRQVVPSVSRRQPWQVNKLDTAGTMQSTWQNTKFRSKTCSRLLLRGPGKPGYIIPDSSKSNLCCKAKCCGAATRPSFGHRRRKGTRRAKGCAPRPTCSSCAFSAI